MTDPKYRIVVTDEDGAVVLDDTYALHIEDWAKERAFEEGMSDEEFAGRAVASAAGIEVCPFDCDHCRA